MTLGKPMSAKVREMNLELNRMETIFQKERLVSAPLMVQLPTGTRCNLRCIFCTDRTPAMAGAYRDLGLEEFIPMAHGLETAATVQLWGWGEPLLNPEYGAIFDYVTANYPGIQINVSTNGTLFDAAWHRRLLAYANFSLNVSVNAATRSTYRLVTGTDLFGRMAANLRGFGRRLRESAGGCSQYSVSFVVVRENLHEIPAFVDLAAEFGAGHVQFMDMMAINPSFGVISAGSEGGRVRELFAEALQRAAMAGISIGTFLPYGEHDYLAMDKYGGGAVAAAEAEEPVALKPCYEPWRNMLVSSDGTASLCCRSGLVTGNLRNDGLEGVWNGDIYRFVRKTVNSADPPDVCRNCPVKLGISS
ncbi:putative mycofactocin radical SAM maturase MftC [Geobacter sp. OR-1]|uniref:radical SAM protein n=1 Tax=Geobacter sp. OR-1 TaxID=1266765 RepID=UPI000541D940|nr:radical SAM protein [Geobacter sp. OR-1]GAM10168.1 putative mycofactocin radical SAM maturase MftC [Geobacter sp. OR-1]